MSVSVLALVLAVGAATALVLRASSAVQYVNVPAETLAVFDLPGVDDSAAVVASQQVVSERLGADSTGAELDALHPETPIVVVYAAMSGDTSKWCRRLSVEVLQREPGVLHYLVERPRWAEYIAGGCEEDAPSPGGVLIPINLGLLDTRTRVILSNAGGPFFEVSCRASEILDPCSEP